jgi:hypothetical protein
MRKIKDEVDPLEHQDKPLWCVYGPDCFPHIICCKINSVTGSAAIWGYSVWKGTPGFRTLGIDLDSWNERYDNIKYFNDKSLALKFIDKLVTPKISP